MLAAVFSLFWTLQASEDLPRARERLAELARRCENDDFQVRVQAQRDLQTLPARLVPEIELLIARTDDVEGQMRLRSALLPKSWALLLPGTIGEVRSWIVRIENAVHPERAETVKRVIAMLERRPPGESTGPLTDLLKSESPGTRSFALEVFRLRPPREAGFIVPFLTDPATAERACALILATGDVSVVPALLPVFSRKGPGQLESARILLEFGAVIEPGLILDAIRGSPDLSQHGCRLLARSGPAAEEPLLALFESKAVSKYAILEALAVVGGPKSVPVLRAYFEKEEEPERLDAILLQLRDPVWARAKLAEYRANPRKAEEANFPAIAAATGPALRDDLLPWLRDPGLKVSLRQKFLPLLGCAGRREDGAFLAEQLRDRRLVDAAAEGLELLGDPAHAGALMQAFKKSGGKIKVGRALTGWAAEISEDDLLEMLGDLQGYSEGRNLILLLAERKLTPRVRIALWDRLLESALSIDARARLVRILADAPSAADAGLIATARAHAQPTVQASGLFLALHGGDAGAARPLAGLLSLPARGLSLDPLLDATTVETQAWKDAVADVWRAKRDWYAGAFWLAAHGNPEGILALKEQPKGMTPVDLWNLNLLLAALGDPGILDQTLRSGASLGAPWKVQRLLAALATPETRTRILAFTKSEDGNSRNGAVGLAAHLRLKEAAPAFRARVADYGSHGGEPLSVLCIDALGRISATEAIPDLRLLLRSTHPASRAAAATALAALGDRAAVPFLVPLLDDPEEAPAPGDAPRWDDPRPPRRVFHAAIEALEGITGVKTGGTIQAERRQFWRDWHAQNGRTWK